MSNIITSQKSGNDMFEIMEKAYKFAEIMAQSDIIPDHYKKKPANVFIAIQTAYRMNLDPMLVMQNTYVVSGKLGMNATFAISLANQSGMFANGIRYKVVGEGQDLAVTASTTLKNTQEEISYTVTMKMAMQEGWTRNPKYKSLPELMLRYRAAAFLIRTHAPEVLVGMHMVEELEDVSASKAKPKESLTDRLSTLLDKKIELSQEALITEENELIRLVQERNIPEETVKQWCDKAGVNNLTELDKEKQEACIEYVKTKY